MATIHCRALLAATTTLSAALATITIAGLAPASAAPASEAPAETEQQFSIAVVPDTQHEVLDGDDRRFRQRTEWLVDNREALDLEFVAHTGDVVFWGWQDPSQYDVADDAMQVLDAARIPYALSIGNHDTRLAATDGGAYAGTPSCLDQFSAVECWSFSLLRHTEEFNAVFPPSRMQGRTGGFESGKVDNSVSTFSAGGTDWLVLSLEMYPRPAVVEWAGEIVASHPDHNVIVQTHHYLDADGSIAAFDSFAQATSPQYLYDNLISRYPNVKMVLSGHIGTTATRVDTGVHGNRIVSLLTSLHSTTTNPVRLITVDTADGSLRTWLTSPQDGETSAEESLTGLAFVASPALVGSSAAEDQTPPALIPVAPVESVSTSAATVMPKAQTTQTGTTAKQAKKLKKVKNQAKSAKQAGNFKKLKKLKKKLKKLKKKLRKNRR